MSERGINSLQQHSQLRPLGKGAVYRRPTERALRSLHHRPETKGKPWPLYSTNHPAKRHQNMGLTLGKMQGNVTQRFLLITPPHTFIHKHTENRPIRPSPTGRREHREKSNCIGCLVDPQKKCVQF